MSANTEYILPSVKSQIGINPEDGAFDSTIIPAINTSFMILKRMGVGPSDGFTIGTNGDDLWSNFMEDGPELEAVKTYVSLRTRMIFDPPTGSMAEAVKENIRELEFSLHFEEDVLSNNEGG